MEYCVNTRELTRVFGSFTAVNKISIKIRRGEIYGFIGPNGSGKSTTIKMLCGLLEPTSGSGTVLGYDLVREPEMIKRKIGYMSQKFSLYDDLTVGENLAFYAGLYNVPHREQKSRIAKIIDMAQLGGREKELTANLSGGYKQRLALGCAIISRPQLLFLDEPTSGVSPISRRTFFKIIQRLAVEGTTVIVTTHFMDEAERCHNIAFLSEGNLIASDTPDSLKNNAVQGCMVEIELPDAIKRLDEIKKLPCVKECFLYGSFLHVLLGSPGQIEDLARYTGARVKVIKPSLEDVFILLARAKRSYANSLA